jgi:hypothetical protein
MILPLGAMLLGFMLAPRAVVVRGQQMRIERRLWPWPAVVVPLSDVQRAAPLDSLGPGVRRINGAGGFFGSYGLFSSDRLGRFRYYSTRGGQAVIVERKSGALSIVLTPDDVAGTIRALDPRPSVDH